MHNCESCQHVFHLHCGVPRALLARVSLNANFCSMLLLMRPDFDILLLCCSLCVTGKKEREKKFFFTDHSMLLSLSSSRRRGYYYFSLLLSKDMTSVV